MLKIPHPTHTLSRLSFKEGRHQPMPHAKSTTRRYTRKQSYYPSRYPHRSQRERWLQMLTLARKVIRSALHFTTQKLIHKSQSPLRITSWHPSRRGQYSRLKIDMRTSYQPKKIQDQVNMNLLCCSQNTSTQLATYQALVVKFPSAQIESLKIICQGLVNTTLKP